MSNLSVDCLQIDDVGGRQYTYSQVVEHVHNCATSLHQLGLQRTQRVCLLLPNCIELPVAFLAVLRLGAICVPFSPSATKCRRERLSYSALSYFSTIFHIYSFSVNQRPDNLTLPMDVIAVIKQNFVCRMLFWDIYRFFHECSLLFYVTCFTQRHLLILTVFRGLTILYCEPTNMPLDIIHNNFHRCWSIFKTLSLLDSAENLQQNRYRTSATGTRHTIDVSLR